MQSELFRPQAIAMQRNRLFGEVVVLPTLQHVFWGAILFVWLIAAAAWLVSSHYSRKVTVSGWLDHPKGVTKMYARHAGEQVKQVCVTEGQAVEAGTTLLLMNGDMTLASGDSLEQSLLAEFQSQRDILLTEISQQELLKHHQLRETEEQIAVTLHNLDALKKQLLTLSKRQALTDTRLQRSDQMMTSGHIAMAEQDSILEKQLHLKNEQQQLVREQLAQQAQLAQQRALLASLPIQFDREANALKRALSELQQQITRLQGKRAYALKAPVAGIVSNVQVKAGQFPNAAIPLVTLVPTNSEVAATLTLPVRAAGFVSPGQTLDIRYDAFPFQKFGLFKGTIEQMPDSVLLPNEIATQPVPVQEPVYLVRVRLDEQSVNAFGRAIPLKSGMTFEADIELAERTMLEWLLEPLYSLRGRI